MNPDCRPFTSSITHSTQISRAITPEAAATFAADRNTISVTLTCFTASPGGWNHLGGWGVPVQVSTMKGFPNRQSRSVPRETGDRACQLGT